MKTVMDNSIYEKINLNPNLPALVGYFGKENMDVRQHFYIPPHWHRSIEITFVTEGELVGFVNGKSVSAKSGDFIFVNSGDVHEVEKYEGQICGGVIAILSYDFIKIVYPNIDQIRFDLMVSTQNKNRLTEIFLEIKEIYLDEKELDYIRMTSYIYEILHLLLVNHASKNENDATNKHVKYKERQKEILVYISENYKEELTLERIANHFHMSSEYFSRKFHVWFGMTYKAYLNDFRLSKAYEDIIKSDKTIQDIAFYHGFSNNKSFISGFKQKYDKTPLRYRQYFKESKNTLKENKK
ncbi:MAG: AraC family transcriptional regulator [Turicibacter sp.]